MKNGKHILAISTLIGAIQFAALSAFHFGHRDRSVDQHGHPKQVLNQEGAPWNGGKPQPPLEIHSTLEGAVQSDTPLDFEVAITPARECSRLTSRLRGIDGVVLMNEALEDHGPCAADQILVHRNTARVPAGVAGYVVVDLEFESTDGLIQTSSRTIPLRTAEAGAFKNKMASKLSKLDVDSAGNPVVIMKAEER